MMNPTPIEITVFATHKDVPHPVYRNIVFTVPVVGDTIYYRFNKRKRSGVVVKVSWEFSPLADYVRAKVDVE